MLNTSSTPRRAAVAAMALALAGMVVSGCTTTSPEASASATEQRQEINSGADATLGKLYETSPPAKDLVARAKGVLVLQSAPHAGFIVVATHGPPVLPVG